MIEIKFFRQVIAWSMAAAVVYSIAVYVYIKHMSFEETFILYVGNFLFAAVIAMFIGWFYKQHEKSISTVRLVVIGGKAAFAGIVLACMLILMLLLIMAPAIFKPEAISHIQLQGSPGQFAGKNQGFGAILFLNAVLGNAAASFFISLLIPFAVMKNIYPDERKEAKRPAIKEENPKKNYHL